MYLLDTNIIIYNLDVEKYDDLKRIIENIANNKIKISTIVLAELEYGISKGKPEFRYTRKEQVYQFIKDYEIIPFDDLAARAFGQIRANLESKGQVIGAYDMLIAAQAVANDLVLVTNNTKEIKRIKELSFDNWY